MKNQRSHFAMDLLPFFCANLMIFILIESTIALEKVYLPEGKPNSALALIKKQGKQLQLATPRKYSQNDEAVYHYEESENINGPREKFFIACPPSDPSHLEAEKNLKKNKKLSEGSKLLIAKEYSIEGRDECEADLVPSIEESKTKTNQVEFEGKVYNVGYPVITMDNENEVHFITIYQICYSTDEDKGMLFILHSILPSVLLQKLWVFYEIGPKESFKTTLGEKDISTKTSDTKYYTYQYVGFDDLPIKSWERATLFSINYTLISKNEDILRGMIAVDNFIRLYSKETEKQLNLLSGSHHTIVDVPSSLGIPLFGTDKPESTEIYSFWRIVMDNKFNAIIIVTQHTLVKCREETYICHDNLVVVRTYNKGGCTYTCSVNLTLLKEKITVPIKKIAGYLTLEFPRKIPAEKKPSFQIPFLSNEPKPITIHNFMKDKKFMSALTYADADLAEKVIVQENSLR